MNLGSWIIYEDNHLLAINKPGGVLSQGDQTGDLTAKDRLVPFIKQRDSKPGNVYLNPAHRLDRTVSGVLLFSKTSKAIARLHVLFRERKMTKRYVCLTGGISGTIPPVQEVEGYIRKNRAQGRVTFRDNAFDQGKYSRTVIHHLFEKNGHHGFGLEPMTGRSHQLRVHMADRLAPILGDVRYGAEPVEKRSIHLHAAELSFIHPVKKEPITIKAPLPQSGMWGQFSALFDRDW